MAGVKRFELLSAVLETVMLTIALHSCVAGVAGLEPTDTGIKIPGLTDLAIPQCIKNSLAMTITKELPLTNSNLQLYSFNKRMCLSNRELPYYYTP